MRFQIFLAAAAVSALGLAGREALHDPAERLGFGIDVLKLGGALLICGLFALKMSRHGIIGAGVVALLGVSLSGRYLAVVPRYWLGERRVEPVAMLSSAAALIWPLLLLAVARYLIADKRRRALAALLNQETDPDNEE